MKSFSPLILPATVCITGASVLIVEIVAVRVLSPYYGNTIFTVSSVISTILLALSVGYYVGGQLADRHPSLHWFFSIILLSGSLLLATYSVGALFLPVLSSVLSITWGPLISSALLFLIPALLLGTLSPYAVKLQSVHFPDQGVGAAAGKIFFWSTLGSIVGSLAAGFVLIPRFGIDQILIANGVGLFMLGLIPLLLLRLSVRKSHFFGFFTILLVALAVFSQAQGGALYSKDGLYEKIVVYDASYGDRPVRFFQQDRSSSGAMYLDSDDPLDLVYDYTKYYALYTLFTPKVERALVIGGGAYSIPKALLAELPHARVDVAEIEPSLESISQQYFRVPTDERLHTYIEDGRRLLRNAEPYDLIFSDVYYSLYSVPAHFTTQEFFALAKSRLASDGVFIASMIGDLSRREPSLIMAEMRTFKSIFPNSYFFAVTSPHSTQTQNIIFVGYNSEKKVSFGAVHSNHPQAAVLDTLAEKRIDVRRFDLAGYPLLTDNFSPVEYLTARILTKSFTERGVDGEEMLALIEQQLSFGPRHLSAPGHTRVQNFLVTELQGLADDVRVQEWDHVAADGSTYPLRNIIARLHPERERRIVLATHYDSKKQATNSQESVPGANDSASGVAVLVEVARAIAQAQKSPAVGIDVVFFDGEEGEENQGEDYRAWKPLGSTYFAQHLGDVYGAKKPIGAVVLDMVCDKDLRIMKEPTSVQHAPTQVEAFWRIAHANNPGVFPQSVGPAVSDDHTPLNEVGIPSFLLIDFTYPYFHTTSDTPDKCSAKSLRMVAENLLEYVYTVE